jgi:hypothetical protein
VLGLCALALVLAAAALRTAPSVPA